MVYQRYSLNNIWSKDKKKDEGLEEQKSKEFNTGRGKLKEGPIYEQNTHSRRWHRGKAQISGPEDQLE